MSTFTPFLVVEIPHQMPASAFWASSLDSLILAAYAAVGCNGDWARRLDVSLRWAERADRRTSGTDHQVQACLDAIGHDLHCVLVSTCPRADYRRWSRLMPPTTGHQHFRVLQLLADHLRGRRCGKTV
jgi:hypothetical protein